MASEWGPLQGTSCGSQAAEIGPFAWRLKVVAADEVACRQLRSLVDDVRGVEPANLDPQRFEKPVGC